ncbi:hypothetical protein EJB05_53531, partial [Eragrostis curvula]
MKSFPVVEARLKWLPVSAIAPWRQEEKGPPKLTPFRIQELPREFSFGEIRVMTQDFGNMVGQGGSAQVFRGHLDDGTAVAVKQITITSDVGEAEFLKEISIIANVHHRSLVRLLGYCRVPEGAGWYLVYPFLENGSLDRWLFHGEERRRLLPWPARRRIAVDVARALAYLHHECRLHILHLDIKPGNVLLDGDLRAHVSDFGISMTVARGNLTTSSVVVDTCGRGTFGYMAPEMLVNAVSAKSDVFSYGMMLLELVGGRRNFEPSSDDSSATPDFTRDYYPCIVREKMVRGELMEVVDAAMPLVDEAEVEVVVKVALCCIQRHRDMRPTMLTVVDMLEGRVTADLPTESRPPSVVNSSEPHSSTLSSKDRGPSIPHPSEKRFPNTRLLCRRIRASCGSRSSSSSTRPPPQPHASLPCLGTRGSGEATSFLPPPTTPPSAAVVMLAPTPTLAQPLSLAARSGGAPSASTVSPTTTAGPACLPAAPLLSPETPVSPSTPNLNPNPEH